MAPRHHDDDENNDEGVLTTTTTTTSANTSTNNTNNKKEKNESLFQRGRIGLFSRTVSKVEDGGITAEEDILQKKLAEEEQQRYLNEIHSRQHHRHHSHSHDHPPLILILPPTTLLPLLVFIDMFAVALVVPLLFQYYKLAGVTSASQREILSSFYSSSQIVGGLVLGALTDARLLRRKTVLFVSFGGSAIAYALMVSGGFTSMIFSRVLVGLVKQTMTVTTSMLAKCTTETTRAQHMGRLQSSSTAAWIAGPSVGAMLYKYVGRTAPAVVACALFAVNTVLIAIFLREIDQDYDSATTVEPRTNTIATGKATNTNTINGNNNNDINNTDTTTKKKKKNSFGENLKACFSSIDLGSVIACTVMFSWFTRATSYASMGSYYEDMYGVESHHRGYIQSYQRILGFIIQLGFIGPILTYVGGERRAACLGGLIVSVATFWESQQSFPLFLIVLSPAISLSTTMMNVSLRTLLTQIAPTESIFSVFAALDVLQSAAAVTVPFYRTALFAVLNSWNSSSSSPDKNGVEGTIYSDASMEGDPAPVSWVLASGLHWCLATLVLSLLLLGNKTTTTTTIHSSRKRRHKEKLGL